MAIKRRQKPFDLAGSSLTVWESSWDISMARTAMEEDARAQKAKLNGSGDPDFLFFFEAIYAPLAACSTGDVPTVEQAYQLPPDAWDRWYETARAVDPDTFGDEVIEPETVELRDGSKITILPSYLPSVQMQLQRLERLANEAQAEGESVSTVTFRLLYYPRLAACSTGDVPSMDEARSEWPTAELDRWYQAARRTNPRLFLPLEEIALQNQEAAEAQQKKKDKRRRKS